MQHPVTIVALRRISRDRGMSLYESLWGAHHFMYGPVRALLDRIASVVPTHEWPTTFGEDAIAALELADPECVVHGRVQ